MEDKNNELCLLIKKAQGERGQNKFAQQCGISSSAITRILSGTYIPSAKTLKKIASRAYNGVTYEMLMNAAGYLTDMERNSGVIDTKNEKITALEEELLIKFREIGSVYGIDGQQAIIENCRILLLGYKNSKK